MNSYRVMLAWLLIGVFCGYAVAADVNTPAGQANVNSPASLGTDFNKVMATVYGVDITEGQVIEKIKPQLDRVSADAPAELAEKIKAQLKQQAMEGIIVEILLDKEVKEQKIVITQEQAVEQLTEMASKQQTPLSLDDLKALIEASGQSFEDVKKQVRNGLGYQKLMEKGLADIPEITEEDAKKYYEENPAQFLLPDQVRASHILIEFNNADPKLGPEAVKARAMETAKKVQAKLQAGEDFAVLAKEYSSCPSATNGGDLDFFSKGRMVPAFEEAAFADLPWKFEAGSSCSFSANVGSPIFLGNFD